MVVTRKYMSVKHIIKTKHHNWTVAIHQYCQLSRRKLERAYITIFFWGWRIKPDHEFTIGSCQAAPLVPHTVSSSSSTGLQLLKNMGKVRQTALLHTDLIGSWRCSLCTDWKQNYLYLLWQVTTTLITSLILFVLVKSHTFSISVAIFLSNIFSFFSSISKVCTISSITLGQSSRNSEKLKP